MSDVLTGNLNKTWRKYLFAALGSAIINSIYSTVDLIIVGQYEGPNGTAAMAVLNPLWSIIMSIGIAFAVGGSVMLSVSRGAGDKNGERYFTVTLISSLFASALLVAFGLIFRNPMYRLFGCDDKLLPLVNAYGKWLIPFLPTFLMGQVLIFFLRNDGAPVLATVAVASCGFLNIFGDLFLVFGCDMGMEGAALATVLCQTISVAIMCSHFFRKKCTLRLMAPKGFFKMLGQVAKTGLSPFLADFSVFITSVLLNNRIMALSGPTDLAVYGAANNVTILVLGLIYGVGGALQPIVSTCFGAGAWDRIRKLRRYALLSAVSIAAVFVVIGELFPAFLLRMYMDVTGDVLAVGPAIMRVYLLNMLFMAINITASYYLQSVLRTGASLLISLCRGFFCSVILLFVLPAAFGNFALWFVVPLSEAITAVLSLLFVSKENRLATQS